MAGAGCAAAFVASPRFHPGDVEVEHARTKLAQLFEILKTSSACGQALVDAGGAAAVVALLRGIAEASLLYGQAVAEADGAAAVVATLYALSGDKEVQRYGCVALRGIAAASPACFLVHSCLILTSGNAQTIDASEDACRIYMLPHHRVVLHHVGKRF